MSSPQKKSFSLKIQAFAYVTAVVIATVFVVYYLVFAANTTIGNNISTSGTLSVTGATTLSSTLLVSGAVNSSSTLQTTGNVHFYGDLTVDGTTNIAGLSFNTATVTGNFWVGGDVSIAGGDINLGTGSATSTLTSSGGFLGIGTTSPSQLLSVHGNAFFSGSLMNVANITATGTLTVSGTGSSSIATALGIASTSPWGTFSVEMGTVNPSFVVSNNGSSTPSLFIGGVNQNGRVGIGTSTPQEALSVVGNISNIADSNSAPKLTSSITLASGSNPASVYVSGRYAYVVQYTTNLLQIFDISTSSPAIVGSVTTRTKPDSVYVAGNYAYVVNIANAINSQFLDIFDVSNPSSPTRVGTIALDLTGAAAWNGVFVKVVGKYAYVTTVTNHTFQVFDVSNPLAPTRTASVNLGTNTNPYFLDISGRYAYVSLDGSGGSNESLRIYDISTSTPALVGQFNTGSGSSPAQVKVSGRYAYLAQCGANNIRILDISNPTSPQSVSTLGTGSGTCPWSISLAGRYLYVLNDDTSGTLRVFDVIDPFNPVSLTTTNVSTAPIASFISGRNLYVVGADSALSTTSYLEVYDVSGIETTSAMIHSLEAGNLQVRNDISAYGQLSIGGGLSVGVGGIFSSGPLSVASSSQFIGSIAASSTLQVTGDTRLYGNLTTDGLSTLAGFISTASSTVASTLQIAGNLQASSTVSANALFVVGNAGIGTTSPSQLLSVHGNAFLSGSLMNVANITATGTLTISGTASSSIATALGIASTSPWGTFSVEMGTVNPAFVVSNNGSSTPSLFVGGVNQNGRIGIGTADPLEAFSVVGNISNLAASNSAPTLISSQGTSVRPSAVSVSGRYTYVVNQTSNNLQVFDVSSSTPALISTVTTGVEPSSVYVAGRYAYVVNGNPSNSLQIFDVSNPSSLSIVGSSTVHTGPTDIFVSGRRAFVISTSTITLQIIDVSNARNPVITGSAPAEPAADIAAGFQPTSLFVSGRYAYVTSSDPDDLLGSLYIFDISTSSPSFVGGFGNTSITDVYVSGSIAYLAKNQLGSGSNIITTVNVSNPANPVLLGNISGSDNVLLNSVYVSGRYVFSAFTTRSGTTDGLKVYDVINPSSPVLVGSLSLTGANSIQVSGRYAYITRASGQNLLSVVDITGLETTSAIIHSLEAGNLQVRNNILAQGQLQVGDSLNVGFGGIFSDGPLAVSATTSKSVIVGGLIIGTSTPATSSPNFSQFSQSVAVIEATSSASVVLTLRGSGSQLGNFFQAQTSDNTNLFLVNSSGGFISSASSTIVGNLSITGVLRASSSATSTFAGGIKLIGGCLQLIDGSCAGSGLSVGGAISGGTGNRVLYEDSSNQIAESANLTFNGATLTVLNASTTGALTSAGGFISSASSTFANALQIAGPVQASSSVTISSTLGVSGLSNLTGFISSASSTIAGQLQLAGALQASSSATIASTLGVSGLSNLSGFISSASSTVAGNFHVSGVFNASSTALINGLSTLTGGFISNASSTLPSGNLIISAGSVGIGTTSPYARLSVKAAAGSATRLFSVASSSDDVYFEISSTGTTTIDQLQTGIMSFDTNAGAVTWIDMPITSSSVFGTVMSYQAMLDASSTLTIYGQSDGAGGVTNQRVGIGTTTPWAMFSIEKMTASSSAPILAVSSMGTTSPYLIINNEGMIGIGTSSPQATLALTNFASTAKPALLISAIGATGDGSVAIAVDGNDTCQDSVNTATCVLNDIAELFPVTEFVENGDLVMFDEANPGSLKKATMNQKNLLAGIISTSPAILFEGSGLKALGGIYNRPADKAPLVLAGKIPVKVNLEGGEIKIGDPITISSEIGIGKKATESGRIVGYALHNFNGLTEEHHSKIMVLASLGDWQAPQSFELETDDEQGLLGQVINLVKAWLESMQVFIENGLVRLKELVAEKITVQQLCVDSVCINSAQFQTLLNNAGLSSPPPPPPAPAPSPVPAPEPVPPPAEGGNSESGGAGQ